MSSKDKGLTRFLQAFFPCSSDSRADQLIILTADFPSMKGRLRNLVAAVVLLQLSLLVGVLGFMKVEGYNLINAFYMAVITISTVGFTEVHALSANGRLFTSIYILINLGIFAYVVSVITSYLFEGKLRSIFKDYMEDRELNKLKDHVIVCGYGRNGSQACEELLKSGRDFVVIEKDPEIRQSVPSTTGFQFLIADATADSNLKLAGIERAAVIIITTPSDAANVFITLTARALKPDIYIISRASEQQTEEKLYRAGANQVIMPDNLGGMFMAQMVTKPVVIEFLDLLTGRGGSAYRLEAVHFDHLRPRYKDKTLKQLNIPEETGCTVIGVKDNIKGLIPSPRPETFIGVDDTLIVLGSDDQLAKMIRQFTVNGR